MEGDLIVSYVDKIPNCDICKITYATIKPAEYDFKTIQGPWAFGCLVHWILDRRYNTLGTGKGQKLVLINTKKQ